LLSFGVLIVVLWLGVAVVVVREASANEAHFITVMNASWVDKLLLIARAAPEPQAIRANAKEMDILRRKLDAEISCPDGIVTRVWRGEALVYSNRGERGLPRPAAVCDATPVGQLAGCIKRSGEITVESRMKIDDDWWEEFKQSRRLWLPLLLGLPLMLLPAWFLVRVGLRPLRQFAATIEHRDSNQLDPLPESRYRELSPLVAAINGLMGRLREQLQREQDFLTDAAHELKTPLAIMQLNSHLLLSEPDDAVRREAHGGLRDGIARASHTVHQLLSFMRTRASANEQAATPLDLHALVSQRLAHAAPLAIERGIEVELDSCGAVDLPLHLETSIALLDNLIGNAIKYSPAGGVIKVQLRETDAGPRIDLNDQGPGIAPELRTKVFKRFYRVPGQTQPGTGLGLCIAERAAAFNRAVIELCDGLDGRGLRVRVQFAR
jgi:two-component system sensor histidine kinase QseC